MKLPFVVTAVLSLLLSFSIINFGLSAFYISLAVIFILSLIGFLYFRSRARRNTNIFIVIPFCTLLLLASAFITLNFNYSPKSHLADTSATMTATVISEPDNYPEYSRYILKGAHPETGQIIKFSAVMSDGEIDIGDRIRITAHFSKISNLYKSNSLSEGIFLNADIDELHIVSKAADPFYTFMGKLRLYIKNVIFSSSKGDPAGVMTALVTGDRSHISDELYAATKTVGVTHFLVVSGLHLSIISAAILLAAKKWGFKKRIGVFIAFAAICLMTVICNFHSSAIRSAFMSLVTLSATLAKRKAVSLNSLGFAVTIMTVINPFIAGSAAFLLSVFATFGVLYLSPALLFLTERLFFKEKPNKHIWNAISIIFVSLSALISVLPLSVYYYGYVSLLSPVVTMLISFAANAVLIMALIATLISPIPLINAIVLPLLFIAQAITKYIIFIINLFAKADFLVLTIDSRYANLCFLLSALLITFIRYIYNKKLKERKDEDASLGKGAQKLA